MTGQRTFSDLKKGWDADRLAENAAQKAETAAEFFARRSQGRTLDDLGRILDKVPDRPPEPGDELPEGWTPDRLRRE